VEERTSDERKLEKLVYDRELDAALKLGVQLVDKHHMLKKYEVAHGTTNDTTRTRHAHDTHTTRHDTTRRTTLTRFHSIRSEEDLHEVIRLCSPVSPSSPAQWSDTHTPPPSTAFQVSPLPLNL
jgi:hypothetical protein